VIQRPSVQPGGRDPAPGQLGLVQAFLNTHYDLEVIHGAEVFATPAALRGWLVGRELMSAGEGRLTARDLRRALAVRESLRSLARANAHEGAGRHADSEWHDGRDRRASTGERHDEAAATLEALNAGAAGAVVEVRFSAGRPRFAVAQRGGFDAALGVLLAVVAAAMIEGAWSRLKVCPGIDCGWAFYDHSRNRSGRWCSMSVCGGRAKARAHHLRSRGEAR
jgi:predicted RNA-binding Zn ribbon-like protein